MGRAHFPKAKLAKNLVRYSKNSIFAFQGQQNYMSNRIASSTFAIRCARTVRSVWDFYYTGFRSMTIGKTLWAIILIKLFVMFAILKLFFFPDILQQECNSDEERADRVRHELTNR